MEMGEEVSTYEHLYRQHCLEGPLQGVWGEGGLEGLYGLPRSCGVGPRIRPTAVPVPGWAPGSGSGFDSGSDSGPGSGSVLSSATAKSHLNSGPGPGPGSGFDDSAVLLAVPGSPAAAPDSLQSARSGHSYGHSGRLPVHRLSVELRADCTRPGLPVPDPVVVPAVPAACSRSSCRFHHSCRPVH